MSELTDMVAMEVRLNYVGASWVAWHYDVTRQQVYRAAALGLIPFVEVPNRGYIIHLFDRRTLPSKFPINVRVRPKQKAEKRRLRMETEAA